MFNIEDGYVYAHIMLSEDKYTPKILLKSDINTLASFILQAVTMENYGVRIVDLLDRHLFDVSLADMIIFKEFRFYETVSNSALRLLVNSILEKIEAGDVVELADCRIENLDDWSNYVEDATDKGLKEDFNKRLHCNFQV